MFRWSVMGRSSQSPVMVLLLMTVCLGATVTVEAQDMLKDLDLSNANLMRASLGGADLTGAITEGANFIEADVTSAKLKSLKGADSRNLEKAYNLKSAFRD